MNLKNCGNAEFITDRNDIFICCTSAKRSQNFIYLYVIKIINTEILSYYHVI